MTKRRKKSTTIYLTPEQHAGLLALSRRSRIAFVEYIREGVDWVLKKYNPPPPSEVPPDTLDWLTVSDRSLDDRAGGG